MADVAIYARDPRVQERFWAKVDKDGPAHPYDPDGKPCWNWTGTIDRKGYGRLKVGSRTDGTRSNVAPHRIVCAMFGKNMASPMECAHSCDNRRCVNPDHIDMVPHTQNVLDKTHRYREARGSRIGCAKLTETMVALIRRDRRSHIEIARELKMSVGTIKRAREAFGWKHVAVVPGQYSATPARRRAPNGTFI